MLTITIKGNEFYDEGTEEFNTVGDVELDLEHSLVSLSKWEAKFEKPFLTGVEKTTEETIEYIKMMVITPNFTPGIFFRFTSENIDQINTYVESRQSATTFGLMPVKSGRSEIVTSELIYYWMVAFNIPFECERWHLNRLFSLIRVCNIKNSKPQKMTRHEIAARNQALNAQRRAQMGSTG